MNKIIFILIACLCNITFSSLKAQENVNASSTEVSTDGGTVSYTVGQLVQNTYLGTNGSSSSSIHQPFEISVINGIDNSLSIVLKSKIYPNPTTDHITLIVENLENHSLNYMLFDYRGKLIEQKEVKSNETIIRMNHLVSSVYFLKVSDGYTNLRTFKIIKR